MTRRPEQHLTNSELATLRQLYIERVRAKYAAERIGITHNTALRHYRQFREAEIAQAPKVSLARVWEGDSP